MKDVAVCGDLIVLEDVSDLPPCEVNEPYLCLVFAKIEIILHLFRLIEDHVSGRHDDFPAVKNKMSLSCRYVNDLPVHPAPWPQSREFGPGVKLISSCTQNPQGLFLFPERDS